MRLLRRIRWASPKSSHVSGRRWRRAITRPAGGKPCRMTPQRAAEIQVVLEGAPLPARKRELVAYARTEDDGPGGAEGEAGRRPLTLVPPRPTARRLSRGRRRAGAAGSPCSAGRAPTGSPP